MTDQSKFPMAIWARPAFPLDSKEELLYVYQVNGRIDAKCVIRWLDDNDLGGFSDLIDYLVYRCSEYEAELENIQESKTKKIDRLHSITEEAQRDRETIVNHIRDTCNKVQDILGAPSRADLVEQVGVVQKELSYIADVLLGALEEPGDGDDSSILI